jgi:hypothetical protein
MLKTLNSDETYELIVRYQPFKTMELQCKKKVKKEEDNWFRGNI